MRRVAVVLVLITALAIVPVTAANDECTAPGQASGKACVRITQTNKPVLPAGPAVPDTPYWGTYFLYANWGACVPGALSTDCRGVPSSSNGVPLPTGNGNIGTSTVGINGLFGVIWQDTNGMGGLQRVAYWPRPADHMLLV